MRDTATPENPDDMDERIRRTVRRELDKFVRAIWDAGPGQDNANQIVADELIALARFVDRRGLGWLVDMLDDPRSAPFTGSCNRNATGRSPSGTRRRR